MELLLPRRGGAVCAAWLAKRCATTWRGQGVGSQRQTDRDTDRSSRFRAKQGQNNSAQVPKLKDAENTLTLDVPSILACIQAQRLPGDQPPARLPFLSFWGMHSTAVNLVWFRNFGPFDRRGKG